MLKLFCDRCGANQPAEIYGYIPQSHPAAQAQFWGSAAAEVKLPGKWEKIRGKHLCEYCVDQVDNVLNPTISQ